MISAAPISAAPLSAAEGDAIFLTGTATIEAYPGPVTTTISLAGTASLSASAESSIDDLFNSPTRRPVYTIEIEPWELILYADAA